MTAPCAPRIIDVPEGWDAHVEVSAQQAIWHYTLTLSRHRVQCRISRFSPPELEGAVLAELGDAARAWVGEWNRRAIALK
jgi:hypothetical protein